MHSIEINFIRLARAVGIDIDRNVQGGYSVDISWNNMTTSLSEQTSAKGAQNNDKSHFFQEKSEQIWSITLHLEFQSRSNYID